MKMESPRFLRDESEKPPPLFFARVVASFLVGMLVVCLIHKLVHFDELREMYVNNGSIPDSLPDSLRCYDNVLYFALPFAFLTWYFLWTKYAWGFHAAFWSFLIFLAVAFYFPRQKAKSLGLDEYYRMGRKEKTN